MKKNGLFPPALLRLLPYYLLVLAVAVFYGNVYDNAFLYDDKYLILQNTYLRDWHSIGAIFSHYATGGAYRAGHFYRPLQNLLYLVIYQMAGPSAFAFHAVNLIFHAANACLAYALGRKLKFRAGALFLAVLVWVLHPINTEAVTYMSATADVMFVFFGLLALVILMPDFAPRKFLIATPLFILALLSKETAIVFPLLAMACMYGLRKPKQDYLRTWPFWLVAAVYLAVRFVFLPFHSTELLNIDPNSKLYGAHITIRIWTFLATLPAYLQLLVWPHGLHMDRDFPVYLDPWRIEVCTGAAMILAALLQVVKSTRNKRGRPLAWGLLWFMAAELPQSGVFVPVNSLFLEHWMYLPSIGLTIGAWQAIADAILQPVILRVAGILAALFALTLGCFTYRQNEIWRDPIVFYRNILDHGESSVRARNNLGVTYMDRGDYPDAMEQFRLALKNNDLTPETHQNIAALLSRRPDGKAHTGEEVTELYRALAIDPHFWNAYEGLAEIYASRGDMKKAEKYRRKAEQLRRSLASE